MLLLIKVRIGYINLVHEFEKAFFVLICNSEPKENPVGRSMVDWHIRKVNYKCAGNNKITISTKESDSNERITDIAECAKNCRGHSLIFAFGSGSEGCSIYGCDCHCELDTNDCSGLEKENGVTMYRFDKGKIT